MRGWIVLSQWAVLLGFAPACTGSGNDLSDTDSASPGMDPEPAFLEDCWNGNVDYWNCTPDCDSPEGQRWADGFRAHLLSERGWTEDQLESSLDVKLVQMEEEGSIMLEAQVQTGWIRLVVQVFLQDELPEPATVEEAAARWSTVWTPLADVLSPPREYSEMEAARLACFAEHDVTMDQELVEQRWCLPALSPVDTPDEGLLYFSFVVDVESDWDSHRVLYLADAHGITEDVCEYEIDEWEE